MAAISKIKPGQTLYVVRRQGCGNTRISRGALFTVVVSEVDPKCGYVIASLNSNPPARYSQREVNKWRVSKPEPKSNVFGMPSY